MVRSCEWRAPARDPFRGDVPAAVDDYTDIPAETRARLKARMAKFAYDDIVSIRRDRIEGNYGYEPALLDMHFGNRRLCAQVTRQSWQPDHEERGLAYCEDGHCIVVPLVCRNVSRIVRLPPRVMSGPPATGAPSHPLSFDAPAAGLPPVPAGPEGGGPTTRTPLGAPPVGEAPPATSTPPAPLPPRPPVGEAPPAPAAPPATPLPPPEPPPVVTPPPTVPAPPPIEPQPSPPLPPVTGMPPLPQLPPAPPVPEPGSWWLWGLGLLAGLALRWTRRPRIGS